MKRVTVLAKAAAPKAMKAMKRVNVIAKKAAAPKAMKAMKRVSILAKAAAPKAMKAMKRVNILAKAAAAPKAMKAMKRVNTLAKAAAPKAMKAFFLVLGIDLPEFYGLMSFILNYIPEFGPIIAITIPIPVIILDSRIPNPGHTLLVALCGLSAIKMFWSNVVEVKLIESD